MCSSAATWVVSQANLQQFSASIGSWTNGSDGSISGNERRGGVDYTFTVASGQEGIFEIVVTGAAIGNIRPSESLPILTSLNGVLLSRQNLVSNNGANGSVRTLTPWLKAGSYTVSIYHDNYRADRRLRLQSVTIQKRGGIDLNSDGIPDWAANKSNAENRLTRAPASSLISPAAIEGVAAWQLPTITTGASPGQAVVVNRSTEEGFYANIPLNEAGATPVAVSYAGGVAQEQASIQWAVANVVALSASPGQIDLRKGDSLRLDAWSGASPAGTFTLSLNGNLLANNQASTSHASGTPFVYQFNTAGTHQLTATWNGQSYPLSVRVFDGSFGAPLSVNANQSRVWQLANLHRDLVIEADNRVGWGEVSAVTGPRQFSVATYETGPRGVIARLPDAPDGSRGPILTHGTVNGFTIAWMDQTNDATLVTTYPDGTHLMHGTMIATGLPDDIAIKLYTHFQSIQFLNGSRTLWLTKASFDANGMAQIYFEMPAGGDPGVCNQMSLFLIE